MIKDTYQWRILADVHPCLLMSAGSPGGFLGNAESAERSGFFAIFGEILRCVLGICRLVLNDPTHLLREEYIPNKLVLVCYRMMEYIFLANPGSVHPCLHISSMAPGGIFEKRGK